MMAVCGRLCVCVNKIGLLNCPCNATVHKYNYLKLVNFWLNLVDRKWYFNEMIFIFLRFTKEAYH